MTTKARYLKICLAAIAISLPLHAQETIQVAKFSKGDLSSWKPKRFVGKTRYQLVTVDGKTVLEAVANASASGLIRPIEIDLNQTPYMNWCWRVTQPLPPLPEETKDGDDYAARIYLVKKGGLAFWRTKAINYVWSSAHDPGASWPNAFAGRNVMMLAVRGPSDEPLRWYCEKRDIRADWKNLFGEAPTRIDAVAVMTDGDNSQRATAAHYGDIWFSKD